MFIRDPWTTETGQVAGPYNALAGRRGLGDLAASDQALLRQLHAVAETIYSAQQDVLAAQQRGDLSYVQARLQDLQRMRGLFASTAEQFQGNDPDALDAVDQFILSAGNWIDGALAALPGAIAAIPNALIEALGKIAAKAGGTALSLSVPILLLGAGLVWLVLQGVGKAERTRTYRRYVA